MSKYYINIKDKKIPIIVRNYADTNIIKMYFKNNVLNISKPSLMNYHELMKFISDNEDEIYKDYIKITSIENTAINHWNTGEKIMYMGKLIDIIVVNNNENKVEISLNLDSNNIEFKIPEFLDYETKKNYIDTGLKNILKTNTTVMINKKLPELSKKIGIEYNGFTIRDSTTRFGACKPQSKTLTFSSRLIMLSENIVDAVIVHELCHIIHPNHSKEFYDLVKKYKADYDCCDKWLKENSKYLNF